MNPGIGSVFFCFGFSSEEVASVVDELRVVVGGEVGDDVSWPDDVASFGEGTAFQAQLPVLAL